MAGNEYDDLVEQVAQTPAPTPINPYDQVLESQDVEQQHKLRTSLTQQADQSPDAAAEATKLAQRTGLPLDVVQRNLPDMQKRAKIVDTPYRQMLQDTPALATWAAEPAHAAVSHDDMEQLGALDWLVSMPSRAISQSLNEQAYGALRTKSIFQPLTQAEQDQMASYKLHAQMGGELGSGDSWFKGALTKSMKLLTTLIAPQAIPTVAGGAAGAVVGGVGGFAVGGPAGVIPGALAVGKLGAEAGYTFGLGQSAFQVAAGSALDEFSETTDAYGRKLDPEVAKALAVTAGAVNAGLMVFGGKVIAAGMHEGGQQIASRLTQNAIKEAIRQPSVVAAIGQMMKSYGTTLTEGTALMVAMKAGDILTHAIAQSSGERSPVAGQLTPGNIDLFKQPAVKNADGSISTVDSFSVNVDGKEVLLPTVMPDGRHLDQAAALEEFKQTGRNLGTFDSPQAADAFAQQLHEDYAAGKYSQPTIGAQLLGAAAEGVQSFALIGLGGPAMGLARNVRKAQQAQRGVQFFQALGEGVEQSKTHKRLPEGMQSFIEHATKDGPVEKVYAPIDTWTKYWQDRDVDPAAMATELTGRADAYEQARKTGEDLAIPTARYATKLAATEHNAFFAQELRLGPDEQNGRESAALIEQIRKSAGTETKPEESPIRTALLEQLTKAGYPQATAEQMADLFSSATGEGVFGEGVAERGGELGRGGEDISKFYERYGLKVSRPEIETPGGISKPDGTPPAPGEAGGPVAIGEAAVGEGLPLGEAPVDRPEPAGAPAEVQRAAADLSGPAGAVHDVLVDPAIAAAEAALRSEALPAGTKDRLREQGLTPEQIDGMTPAEAADALKGKVAVGKQIPGARPVSDYSPADLANEATRVREMASARRLEKGPRERVLDRKSDAEQNPENYLNAEARKPAPAEEGQRPADLAGQQPGADVRGDGEGRGDGDVAQPGRTTPRGIPEIDEVFRREDKEATTARLTPEVERNLRWILEELVNFPFIEASWHWLTDENAARGKSGNAAGGNANKTPAMGGAPVFNDVIGYSPVNERTVKGEKVPARDVHGSRNDVRGAIEKLLETGHVTSNLMEGALRVAENRNAGNWRDLERPMIPPPWGEPVTREFTDALADAIDQADKPGDMKAEAGIEQDSLETAEGDTSFDITEFSQSLFDALEDPDPTKEELTKVDRLETGELQPRLPVAGDVREQNVQTPAFEAPFSLTSEVSTQKGKQTTLFQEPAPVTQASLDQFAEQVKAGHGTDVDRFQLALNRNGDIALEWIIIDRGAQRAGVGSDVMRQLTRYADANGRRILLSPAEDAGSTRSRLVNFYKRFGFVENKGRDRDFSTRAGMYRDPNAGGNLGQPLFHGSPHDFERFSLEHVGTGEGAASYGHGLYFAENPAVAANYHDQLSEGRDVVSLKLGKMKLRAPELDYTKNAHINDVENIRAAIAEDLLASPLDMNAAGEGGFRDHVLAMVDQRIADYEKEYPEGVAAAKKLRAELEKPGALAVEFTKTTGGVYQVDIPDAHIDKMLDWDAPLDEQPAAVQQLAKDLKLSPALIGLEHVEDGWQITYDGQPVGVPYNREQDARSRMRSGFRLDSGDSVVGATGEGVYHALTAALEAKRTKKLVAERTALEAKHFREGQYSGASRESIMRGTSDWTRWNAIDLELETINRGAAKEASDKLAAAGVPGLRYLDQGSRDTGEGTRNVVVFDDSIVTLTHKDGKPFTPAERKEFFQGGGGPEEGATPEQRRGAIRFGPDRQFSIDLLEKADLSTFLHESGHFFLEVFGDIADNLMAADPETLTDQQKHVLSDYGVLLQHLGVENRGEIGTPQHEQFARSFEAYLMEGKAPSLSMRTPFARFRAWLTGIYRSLKNLNVRLTPEVTGVMDRLLASDQAIKDAEAQRGVEPMFSTAESAGMEPSEFALYARTIADASKEARETLDRKLLAEVHREQQAEWKARRGEVKLEVADQVQRRPEYQAISAMLDGTNPDGSPLVEGLTTPPLKLDRKLLEEMFGKDRVKRLPRGIIAAGEGVNPDLVASMYGYSSADAMLTAVEKAPPMRDVIEQQTKRRMIEEHGSILLDGTLPAEAQASVANETRDAVIRAEMRALGRKRREVDPFVKAERAKGRDALAAEKAERDYERRWFEAEAKLRIAIAEGHKQVEIDALTTEVRQLKAQARGGAAVIRAAIPDADTVKAAALERVAGTKVRDLNPAAFWSASRRAGTQALEKAARQDFDGAITAKSQELINLAIYREMERAKSDADARARYAQGLTSKAARERLGKAGGSYLDQVDGVLDRYEFARVSQKALDRRARIKDWVDGLHAQGLPVEGLTQELLDDSRRINWKETTVAELTGVTDGLKQIEHLARLKNRLLKAADKREFEAVRDGVADGIRANLKERPKLLEVRPADQAKRIAGDYFASHRKLASLAQMMDGHVDGGPMWEAFIRPINEAGHLEETRRAEAGGAYMKILDEHYPGREILRLNEKLHIPAIDGSLSLEGRLAVAQLWGSETGRERLTNDPYRKWNEQQVLAILDTLDKRDWDFVAAHWQNLDSFWSEIAAKQERVTGLAPEKVDPLPVQTKFGEYPGGYSPLAYDGRFSVRAGQNEAASQAKLTSYSPYVQNTTKRGFVEQRVKHVGLPVRLELSVGFQHIDEVIHDLTHHEMLIDVTRLLRDPKVSSAMMETAGDIVYQQFTRGIQDIAIGSTPAARNVGEKAANFLRSRTQLALLGLNLWTGLQQPLGVFNGMDRVGVKWVAKGMGRWLRDAASMEKTTTWIAEVSPMMRERVTSGTQDLHDLRAAFNKPGGWFDKMVRTVSNDKLTQQAIVDGYLWHIGIAQRVADVPTWLGGYEKAMAAPMESRSAAEHESRAIALADQAVLDSQGGGQVKDLAQIQRGGPYARLFMTFYSYGNTVLNATARNVERTNFRSPASVMTFLGHMSLLYVLPALGTATLACGFGKKPCKDAGDFLATAGGEMLSTSMNTMVYVRELAGAAAIATGGDAGARGYGGPAALRPFEWARQLSQQVNQKKADEGLWHAANNVAGFLFKYPAAQVQRTIDGYIALSEGRTSNPGALLVGPPPKNKK